MLHKYFGVFLVSYFLLLCLQQVQHCDAIGTGNVSGAQVPSEMFQTVNAPTEKPLVIKSMSTSSSGSTSSDPQQSEYPTYNQVPSPQMFGPSQQSRFRPVQSNFITPTDPYQSPFPMGQHPSNIQRIRAGSGMPFEEFGGSSSGSGSSSSFFSSSSSSSSLRPMGGGSMGGGPMGSGFPMSGPSMSRFQTGPSMSPFPSGPSGFSGGSFGGGSSDGFYRVSSSQTSYDSDIGVPITKNFEYDSRTGGGFFRRK